MNSEEKGLKWQEVELKAEVAKWNEYKENVLQWQFRTELAIHANITDIARNNGAAVDAQFCLRLPCSRIATE